MELTPDTTLHAICCIREIIPDDITNKYPYRDVLLWYNPSTRLLEFPSFELSGFTPDMIMDSGKMPEKITNINDIDVYVIRGASQDDIDTTVPFIFGTEGDETYMRVLMSEIGDGFCCHVPIAKPVRDLFFPKNKTHRDDVVRDITEFHGYTPDEHNRTISKLALVTLDSDIKDEITSYYPIPIMGYHGTSEHFIEDIIGKDGNGLKPTTENGLYGNNVYYFGNFHKAIRYAFRDSQYATIPEDGALRTKDIPGGVIRVPSTRFKQKHSHNVVEDVVRDSPALIRFVLFPTKTIQFPSPSDKPVSILPLYGTKKASNSLGISSKSNPFIVFRNTPSEHPVDMDVLTEKIKTATITPLFNEPSDTLVGNDTDPVIPLPPPTSIVNRRKAVIHAYKRIHIATRNTLKSSLPKGAASAAASASSSLDETHTSVIFIREPDTLPDLGDFFLMTSGFFTDEKQGIPGDSVNYINEDEIREITHEMMSDLCGDDSDMARPRPFGNTTSYVDYRIVMEDLLSVIPKHAPTLVSCGMMPAESILRMKDVLSQDGKHNVIIIYGKRKDNIYPVNGEENSASPHAYTDKERLVIRSMMDSIIKQVGDPDVKITYTPPASSILFGKGIVQYQTETRTKICSIRMEPGTYETSTGQRIMHDRAIHSSAYTRVYPNGGSYRVYDLEPPKTRSPARILRQADDSKYRSELLTRLHDLGWNSDGDGESNTLIVHPFTYEANISKYIRKSKAVTNLRSFTQHTEIVIKHHDMRNSSQQFIPLSWHRGDQRTMYRHHHPMDCGMKVL